MFDRVYPHSVSVATQRAHVAVPSAGVAGGDESRRIESATSGRPTFRSLGAFFRHGSVSPSPTASARRSPQLHVLLEARGTHYERDNERTGIDCVPVV